MKYLLWEMTDKIKCYIIILQIRTFHCNFEFISEHSGRILELKNQNIKLKI